jgi:hypothetical protein
MSKIKTSSFNTSWIEEEYDILPIYQWKKENEISQFFIDKKTQEIILEKIQNRHFTTIELEWLIAKIKIEEMKVKFEEYLKSIKEYEMKIINFLKKKWLLKTKEEEQAIKFNFIWVNFEWIDGELLYFIEGFNQHKWSFQAELEKVNNEKEKYLITITVNKNNWAFYVKEMKIDEDLEK